MIREVLAKGDEAFPEGYDGDDQRAMVQECLARVAMRTERWDDAETHFKRALEFRERYPDDADLLAETRAHYAEVLVRLDRSPEAEVVLAKAWPVLCRNCGPKYPIREKGQQLLQELARGGSAQAKGFLASSCL